MIDGGDARETITNLPGKIERVDSTLRQACTALRSRNRLTRGLRLCAVARADDARRRRRCTAWRSRCRRCRREFGVARADASLPYTLTMIGFGVGGILMGRLADRFGVMVPVMIGALGLGGGLVLAGNVERAPAVRASRTGCWSACSAARRPSRRWSPTPRSGSPAGAASRWPSEQRQLSRRRGLAADPAVLLRPRRLARDLCRHRHLLHCGHAAARAVCN